MKQRIFVLPNQRTVSSDDFIRADKLTPMNNSAIEAFGWPHCHFNEYISKGNVYGS